jgi:hypothetical protein
MVLLAVAGMTALAGAVVFNASVRSQALQNRIRHEAEVRSTRKTRCASARASVLIEHDPRPGYEPAPPFFIGLLASEFEETTFVVLDPFVDGAGSIWGDP